MARMDRIAVLFVVIVVYSAMMNIFLINFLDDEDSNPGMDLKSKIRGFIHHHRYLPSDVKAKGAANDSEELSQDHQQHPHEDTPAIMNNNSNIDQSNGTGDGADEADNNIDDNNKDRIINILKAAGTEITPEIIASIPTWGEVKSLYGDKPKILGLEQCSRFQLEIPEEDAYIGPTGLFNTGTNLLADLLQQNCKLPKRKWDRREHPAEKMPFRMQSGMLYQVPWGKHNPITYRSQHAARLASGSTKQENVLPIVMIKDPFYWMGSICRHKYATNWFHTKDHCPNLVPNEFDFGNRGITRMTKSVPVRVRFQDSDEKVVQYTSMIDFWNTWYSDYLDVVEFPRLIIRFEDILFHLEEVLTQVCHCGGGEVIQKRSAMHLKSQAAKRGTVHNGSSGLLSAITTYGSATHRLDGMTADDIKFANEHARSDLMELFSYSYPSIPEK